MRPLSSSRSVISRSGLSLTALLAVCSAHADALRVTAANSASDSSLDNRVYDVNFAPPAGTTAQLNSGFDQGTHTSLQSLVYVLNESTGKLDLLAADTPGGAIVRYSGASGTATTVWSTSGPYPGPVHPDGLSVDAAGNLYVVSSPSPYVCCASPPAQGPSHVWVLRRDPAQPRGAAFLAPLLMQTFPYESGDVEIENLKDTLVVRTAGAGAGGLGVGDLLVLVGDNNDKSYFIGDGAEDHRVLRYSAASIQSFLGGGPAPLAQTLLTPDQFIDAGIVIHFVTGMDLWPADGSLLIADAGGSILRFNVSATAGTRVANFSSGLGAGLAKLKTGVQSGTPYAVVAQAGLGQILEFNAPGAPLATVTQNVSSPQGLALTNAASADATTCVAPNSCDLLGGALIHQVVVGAQPVTGTVTESSCVVNEDPRLTQFHTCTGHTLPVSQVCPGFGNTVIPDYLCGGTGPTAKGFALVRTVADGVDSVPGILVSTEGNADNIVGTRILPDVNPLCPQTTLAWAPRSDSTVEGTIAEGSFLVEQTGYCGSSGIKQRGMSIWGIGLTLNTEPFAGGTATAKLVTFSNQKFTNLSITLTNANIAPLAKRALSACVSRAQTLLNKGYTACAARKSWRCDQIAANNSASFGSSANNPNPYGDVRGRLANIFLTIDARILGHAPATTWPLAAPPARCLPFPDDN